MVWVLGSSPPRARALSSFCHRFRGHSVASDAAAAFTLSDVPDAPGDLTVFIIISHFPQR